MKTGFIGIVKKTIAWALTLVMVAGLITVYPAADAKAGEGGTVTLHYYYTGTGTPTVSTPTAIEGREMDFSYWGRYSYFMEADEVNGEGWYTFDFTENVDVFQILSNNGEAGDESTWLENVGYECDEDSEAKTNYYEIIACAAEDTGIDDLYMAHALTSSVSPDYGGQGVRLFYDQEYYVYNEETEEDIVVATSGVEIVKYELELQEKLNTTCDYYIGGAQYDGVDEEGNWVQSAGIFSDVYAPVIMTATGNEGEYEINLGEAVKGNIYYFSVYGSPTYLGGWQGSSAEWNNTIVKEVSFTAAADAYVKITVDVNTSTYTIGYYSDAECTEEVEIVAASTTMYYYYTGDYTPTLAFGAPIAGLTEAGTYWARTAYAMTAVSGYDNWYSFELLDSYGDFQIIANPSGEDDDSSIWLANFQSSDNYSLVDFDSDANVYYRGRMFKSLTEALAYTDWDYYISGSNADYSMESEFNGTSNNIFTNYWSAPVGVYDDNGTTSYYKDETAENWADRMTETSDGIYTVTLPNKAVEGTAYAFNVYVEKDWNEQYYSDAQTFTALADGYVKITLNTNTDKYAVDYYSDEACTEEISVTEDTIRFYIYYTGSQNSKVCIVFDGNMENDLSTEDIYNTYWGNSGYLMTREMSGNSYTGWYYFDIKPSYGSFQIVANPQGENDVEDTTDRDGTIWIANVYDDNYASVLEGSTYLYRGKYFTSKARAEAYTDWSVYIAGGLSVSSEPADSEKAAYKGIFTNFWATANTPHTENGQIVLGDDGLPYYDEEWADQMSGNYSLGTYTYQSAHEAVKGKTYSFGVYYEQSWTDAIMTGSFTAAATGYVKVSVDVNTGEYTVEYYSDAECTELIEIVESTDNNQSDETTDDGDSSDTSSDTDSNVSDTDSDSSTSSGASSSGATAPKTGDNKPIVLAVIAIIAASAVVIARKKKIAQ